jgi:hypothetical protein
MNGKLIAFGLLNQGQIIKGLNGDGGHTRGGIKLDRMLCSSLH